MTNCPPMVDLAVRFVTRESAGLAWALRSPHDPAGIRQVLRWHDEAHCAWLSLLASCRAAGWPSATNLGRLYAFHGQVAELLEHGEPDGTLRVRDLLDEHLCRLTETTVAGLCADARAAAAASPIADADPAASPAAPTRYGSQHLF